MRPRGPTMKTGGSDYNKPQRPIPKRNSETTDHGKRAGKKESKNKCGKTKEKEDTFSARKKTSLLGEEKEEDWLGTDCPWDEDFPLGPPPTLSGRG